MMCCYYPTTTMAIDDDANFLEILTAHLGIPNCIPHSSPSKAIATISKENAFQRIHARIFKKTAPTEQLESSPEDYAVIVNARGLHEEIYNKERFRDTSVIIVDYYMGEISGIDVCEALAQHPAKKILLTGSLEKEQVAIEAFNKGLIHRFISKTDPELPSKLKLSVSALKEAYFRDLSATLLPHSTNTTNPLQTPAYINFVKNLQQQFNAVEYYVIDLNGSCLFLDAAGNTTWFIIKHESELENFAKIAQDQEASPDLTHDLMNHQVIPFFFSEEDYQHSASDWGQFVHQAQPLSGANGYYYAICEGRHTSLNHHEIATYASYQS